MKMTDVEEVGSILNIDPGVPVHVEDDILNNLEEDIAFLPAPNGKQWYSKVQDFFKSRLSFSESNQRRDASYSVFERNSSSISQSRGEERMCKELRYFFMNPCQKYKARKRKPFKLTIQIFKIALVTLQLIIFGTNNQNMVNFMNDSFDVLHTLMLNDTTSIYRKSEVYTQLNNIREQYSLFENYTVGNYGYYNAEPGGCFYHNEKDLNHTIKLCSDEYVNFDADLDHNHIVYDAHDTKRVCYCLQAWSAEEKQKPLNEFVPLANGSLYQINFHKMNALEIYMGIRTVRLLSSHSYHIADCYNITVIAKFDNAAHTGKITHDMDVKFALSSCPQSNSIYPGKIETKPIVMLLMTLDVVIILTCSMSLILCARSLWRGYRLRKSFERFYWKRYHKKLEWYVKFDFFNGWYFLIIVSDILTIAGSITKLAIEIEWKGVINYDMCSILLGVGCLCVWVGVLRYAGFFHQYNILVLTLKKSMPHVLRFMVCASVLYLGFLFCGWVVLGPYHHKFRDPVVTSEALFSLINGDDMYMTYEEMSKKSSLAWAFSQIYLYVFISLFIYIVLSLFIAVILETYETIKEWQSDNFPPQNVIQKFLADHSDPDEDIQYDYNSDTYCCCCLYHNNDPDIDYDSSDEEMVVD